MLILHIGYHKTGSTAIQSFLCRNRDIFSTKAYSCPRTINLLGHPDFCWAIDRKDYPWQDRHYSEDETMRHYERCRCQPVRRDNCCPVNEEFCRLEFDQRAMHRLWCLIAPYRRSSRLRARPAGVPDVALSP